MTQDIQHALTVLRHGGVILYPTDTVWGIGCDATCADAVRRVFDIKKRADGKALITLLADANDLWRYVDGVPDVAFELIDAAVRPLTVIYDKALMPPLAPNLPAADGSLALRRPLVSTSANISGQPTPSVFAEISKEIIDSVDYVCATGRDYAPSEPSSIVHLTTSGCISIIRR